MFCALIFAALTHSEPVPAFTGSWVGTLEYRDYSDNSRQKLGTLLRIYQPKGSSGWTFRYVYDDGPKKVVTEIDNVSIDFPSHQYVSTSEDGKEVNRYQLDAQKLSADGIGTMVLRGKGTENGVVVDIRQTLAITKSHLDILRESSLKGVEFKFRHRYSFDRVGDE